KRTWALMLALFWFVGAGGIHRLYVGKIGTGIIWLLTGGLFGVGQLIDVIKIHNGTFTDANGRRLLLWDDGDVLQSPLPTSQTARDRMGTSARGERARQNGLLSALAGWLLFIGTVVGLAIALDLPNAANVGIFGPKFTNNLQANVFNGYPQWPELAHKLGVVIMAIVFLIGVVAMLFARSHGGVAYQIRGGLAVAGLILTTAILHLAFAFTTAWTDMAPQLAQKKIPAAIDTFLNHWRGDWAAGAGLVFLVSIVLMAWPAKPQKVR
ncbi:MAG TPA: TM2 domain-containing protein, partial [Tepidisphaeraceae bacterium]|nr:TM2 domain-containing protein [Tepidisphaeraceae bacterium]